MMSMGLLGLPALSGMVGGVCFLIAGIRFWQDGGPGPKLLAIGGAISLLAIPVGIILPMLHSTSGSMIWYFVPAIAASLGLLLSAIGTLASAQRRAGLRARITELEEILQSQHNC